MSVSSFSLHFIQTNKILNYSRQKCALNYHQAYKSAEKPTITSAALSSSVQPKSARIRKPSLRGEKHIIDFLSSLVSPSRTAKGRIEYVVNAIKKRKIKNIKTFAYYKYFPYIHNV